MNEQDCIQLEIVTPEKTVLKKLVQGFTLPTPLGRLGVLRSHAPLITVVEPGLLRYRSQGKEEQVRLGRGFLEFQRNQAVLLLDQADPLA